MNNVCLFCNVKSVLCILVVSTLFCYLVFQKCSGMVPEGTVLAVGFYYCFKSTSNVIRLSKIPCTHKQTLCPASGKVTEIMIPYSEIAFEAT